MLLSILSALFRLSLVESTLFLLLSQPHSLSITCMLPFRQVRAGDAGIDHGLLAHGTSLRYLDPARRDHHSSGGIRVLLQVSYCTGICICICIGSTAVYVCMDISVTVKVVM